MLKDVVATEGRADYRLYVRFEDGAEGMVNVKELVEFHGIFEPLSDPGYFTRVRVDAGLGTVVWPNGADLDPDVLYARVAGVEVMPEGPETSR